MRDWAMGKEFVEHVVTGTHSARLGPQLPHGAVVGEFLGEVERSVVDAPVDFLKPFARAAQIRLARMHFTVGR